MAKKQKKVKVVETTQELRTKASIKEYKDIKSTKNDLEVKHSKLIFKQQKYALAGKVNKVNKLTVKLEEMNKEIAKLETQLKAIETTLGIKPSKSKVNYAITASNFNAFYGANQRLFDVNIKIPKNQITAIIGPSGCGKSTFLRSINRINDEIPNFRVEGKMMFDERYNIYTLEDETNDLKETIDISYLRTKIGMIFQQPNPFPMSIYKNVTYAPKINGIKDKDYLEQVAEQSLKDAALWDEVKENWHSSALGLSGGQQQRLCIARALANQSEILLLDEPTSALDPIAASKIEELMLKLKKKYTIIFVTHSMQQAARISDYTAFFHQGKLIEFDKTDKMFTSPKETLTDDYIRGRFG